MINSRSIAFFTSIFIAVITTSFLWLVPSVTTQGLVIAFLLSFSSSYILIRVVLDTVFFRHINTIYEVLEKIQHKDFSFVSKQKPESASLNPLKKLNREIFTYASQKQEEIERLKQMEHFRREFIADISHELKTPLFAAQGFVHTLLDGAVKDKSVRDKFLKKAARSLDGLDILIQDLLTISQMETGEIKMHFESFDLIRIINRVIEQMEGKSDKKKIEISLTEDSPEKAYVHADYQRIFQVLTNLVSNAIKYNHKKGWIKIRVQETETDVLCSIQDSGLGIPPEDLGRIFERFYRVDKSRSKERGGTGLGLAIVKHIMEGHGSTVEVASEVGKGSTFAFRLIKGRPSAGPDDDDDDD
jgi:two-component system, OmpR family, phosphate regulon sensor histidine kinase PhoR